MKLAKARRLPAPGLFLGLRCFFRDLGQHVLVERLDHIADKALKDVERGPEVADNIIALGPDGFTGYELSALRMRGLMALRIPSRVP